MDGPQTELGAPLNDDKGKPDASSTLVPMGLMADTHLWSDLKSDKLAMIGLLFLVALLLSAAFAAFLSPYDPAAQNIIARLKPPMWMEGGSGLHVLGTDHLGRDVMSRLLHGTRVSLLVGVGTVLLAGGFGVFIGLVSGYRGGRVDAFLVAVIDTNVAFPGLLLALLILAVIGPSTTTVIVVLALNGWMVYARMTRGIVLSMRATPFIEAAEVIGCRPGRVLWKHILPNLTAPLLTLATLEFARIVLAEAALSFLGLGIQPPATSWGLDVAQGKEYMFRAWWLVTLPGLAIALTVLAINLVASWLRVTSDPVEREKRYARRFLRKQRLSVKSQAKQP
ncbi:MAG: ABC-type dipeptide/oligopeptide/nickel transport system permease subunit [bacterium]|jgi:peptide/nickel transport system permease protein